ncbi:MAG: efflux RND transporter permease subunit [Oceanicaulis sp.]
MATGLSDLPALSVRRPILACVANLLIVIAGLAAVFGVEVRELPDVDRPVVSVDASYPGAAPETVDAEVTRVLEGAVARASGVEEISSASEENSSRIRVRFRPGVDLDTAAADVREAVNRVEEELPDRVDELTVVKADDEAEPVLRIAVQADRFDEAALTERIENDIAPEFQAIDGVATVTLFGARERQLRVVLDPLRLSRFGLTVADVADALEQAPYDVPVGSFASEDQSLLIRAEAVAGTPELVEEVVISGETTVGDVADAFFGPADATNFVRLDGDPIIGFGVIRQAQSNTIEIARDAREAVDRLNARFDDLELVITSDAAVFIERSVSEVLTTLAFTTLIVVATIWLFFGSFRATLIPALAIPTALIGSLGGIWLFGFSINLLTLLALVLATGLIVDDAIVVLENMQRQQKRGVKRLAAAVLGARQVFFAVIATTAVLISVFVPISFLPSTAGRLFREFGFTLALAVTISSFVALTLVPALGARLDMAGEVKGIGKRLNAIGGWLARRYRTTLRAALGAPWITVTVALMAALGAAFALVAVERELVPEEDRGEVSIFATGPSGVDLTYMEQEAAEIDAVLQPHIDSGLIENLYTVIGRYDPNRIGMTATLAPWEERDTSQQELIAELEGPLSDIPGARVSVFGRGSLDVGGGRSGLEVALTGEDYTDIYEAGRALSDLIDTDSELLSNPELSYQPTQPQISIRIDRRRAADLGVSLEDLSQTLRVMVDGDDLVDLSIRDQAIPIFLSSQNTAIRDPGDLRNLYVRSDAGDLVAISSLATFVEEGVAAELDRTEQRRAIELEADIAPDTPLADAVAEIERLADESLPDGVEMLLQGEAETLGETSRELLYTYLFAFVIVFLVLAAQFESLTSPVVVILTVPFGLAAALYALFLTGTTLNIYSQIGLVMLIGLMAKNGILMVEFADQRRADGDSVREAIETAAEVRLRPVMMTLISTVLGALPLILSSGAGAEARHAIGWTVFAGLGLSGLFTLFLTPVVYLGIARLGRPRAQGLKELEAELQRAQSDGAAS